MQKNENVCTRKQSGIWDYIPSSRVRDVQWHIIFFSVLCRHAAHKMYRRLLLCKSVTQKTVYQMPPLSAIKLVQTWFSPQIRLRKLFSLRLSPWCPLGPKLLQLMPIFLIPSNKQLLFICCLEFSPSPAKSVYTTIQQKQIWTLKHLQQKFTELSIFETWIRASRVVC